MAGINRSQDIQKAKQHLRRFLSEVRDVTDQEIETLRINVETKAKAQVPYASGELHDAIQVTRSRSRNYRGINVKAVARNPRTGYNYALIQHENEAYHHSTGKAHFISDPFNQEVENFKRRVKRRLKKNG